MCLDTEIASCERFLEYLTHTSSFSLLMTIVFRTFPGSDRKANGPPVLKEPLSEVADETTIPGA
jgi:hypothetical protein